MTFSAAGKRYNKRVIWLSLLYAAFLVSAVYGFKHQLLAGPLAYLAAILPAVPIIGIFGAMGRYLVEEQDEYVRMLMVRQTLWASAFALSIATVWGFLESFDMVGHVDAYYVAVLWFGGLGLGSCINKLTLGSPVGC
jgi:xanthosine utilization system XapX-like protein